MNANEKISGDASQFETNRSRTRIVLLGASNLATSFPKVIELARSACEGPLELFVAMGFGRSYGQESKFFGKIFPGILQSQLWAALDRAEPRRTLAIVADVGNDLAYNASVEQIAAWVREALDRLTAHGALVALSNLPIEPLRRVGGLRYRLLRALFFPRCTLPRDELVTRAEALSEALEKVAQQRKTPVIHGENAWFGFDPIHPRRRSAGTVWRSLLGAIHPPALDATWAAPPRADARVLRRLQSDFWAHNFADPSAERPRGRLADGTTIALF